MRKLSQICQTQSEKTLRQQITDTDSYSSLKSAVNLSQSESIRPRSYKKRIGPYSYYPGDVIGCGFSSVVYRGVANDDKHKVVALKMVKLNNMSKHRRSLLQNEIKLLKRINHPNIVNFIDAYYTPNNCYIITQFCQGGSLKTLVQSNASLDVGQIIKDIGAGCQYLANLKIMHRDIKPANILLRKGVWKLGDFGFAYQLRDLNTIIKQQFLIGSPIFMPLQSLTNHWYSSKCDSFAMGVFIFYLFCREYPWSGRDKTQLIRQLTQFAPNQQLLDLFPPKAKYYLLALLHPKISQRISLMDCDFQVFAHVKPLKNIKTQLSNLSQYYAEQVIMCQYVHYLMMNIPKYQGINEDLMQFMGRHLGSLVKYFKWHEQLAMAKIIQNYNIPEQPVCFQSDDWHWLNNCLKQNIKCLIGNQDQPFQVLLQKLLYYQLIVESVLHESKEQILACIRSLTLHSNFDWLRPNPQNIVKMLNNIDFSEL